MASPDFFGAPFRPPLDGTDVKARQWLTEHALAWEALIEFVATIAKDGVVFSIRYPLEWLRHESNKGTVSAAATNNYGPYFVRLIRDWAPESGRMLTGGKESAEVYDALEDLHE